MHTNKGVSPLSLLQHVAQKSLTITSSTGVSYKLLFLYLVPFPKILSESPDVSKKSEQQALVVVTLPPHILVDYGIA